MSYRIPPGLDKSLHQKVKDKLAARAPVYYRSDAYQSGRISIDGVNLESNPTQDLPPGMVWVRQTLNDDATQSRAAVPAINAGIRTDIPGVPCWCGYTTPENGSLVAYAVRGSQETVNQYGVSLAGLGVPATPPELQNTPYPAALLLDGLVTKSLAGGMNIAIQAFDTLPGLPQFDVSGHTPGGAGERRWTAVSANLNLSATPNAAITLTDGTAVLTPQAIYKLSRVDAEAIETPLNDYPLAAILFENGQTVVDDTTVIIDLRKHLGATVPKVNYDGGSPPTVNDDEAEGYSVGSEWYNGANIYDCTDATTGAAVWTLRGTGSVTGSFPISASMWHYTSTVLAGTALTFASDSTSVHNGYYLSTSPSNGDSFQQTFFIAAGTYTFHALGWKGANFGKVDWYLDGVVFGTYDYYNGSTLRNQIMTIASVVVAVDGVHTLKGTVNGQNGLSTGFFVDLIQYWFL